MNNYSEDLSPSVMAWSHDGPYIADLRPTLTFWKSRFAGTTLLQMLRDIYPAKPEDILVVGKNAWLAILLFHQMRERTLRGYIATHEGFGAKLLNEVSWDIFWKCADQLIEHAVHCGLISSKNYTTMRRRFREAMQKMHVISPLKAKELGVSSIQRRFGKTVSFIWDMWNDTATEDVLTVATRFPWRAHKTEEIRTQNRLLDFESNDWIYLQQFLRADFHSLFTRCVRRYEHMTCLEWCLHLSNHTSRLVPIVFRHPYQPLRESPHYQTALLQAQFQFEKYEEDTTITGWDLKIQESLHLPPKLLSLFGDTLLSNATDHLKVSALENQLGVPLQRFICLSPWTIEDSFKELDPGALPETHTVNEALQTTNLTRPLFIYPEPRRFQREREQSALWRFCERVGPRWWDSKSTRSTTIAARDYYEFYDDRGASLWVFRDNEGQWWTHGVYH